MALLGAVCGLLGALWTALCTRLLALRARFVPGGRPALRNAEVMLVAAATATVRAAGLTGKGWAEMGEGGGAGC